MLLTPSFLSQTVTPTRTPCPLERDVLYGRPLIYHTLSLNWTNWPLCYLWTIMRAFLKVDLFVQIQRHLHTIQMERDIHTRMHTRINTSFYAYTRPCK